MHDKKLSDAVALAAGLVLVLAFFAQEVTSNGFRVNFTRAFNLSTPGELNFWLSQALLLCPGMLLIGVGVGNHLLPALRSMAARLQTTTPAERYLGLATLTLLAFSAARIGRSVFLLDMPITDDELAVEFGGRVLASLHLFAPLQLPPRTVPALFLLVNDAGFASFDWPGGVVTSAIATLTHSGAILWAVIAAIPVAAIAIAVGARLGAAWGLAAALIFVCSPMAGLLSMTTHSQLVSRMFFSLALMAFSFAEKDDRPRHWLLTGVFLGLAFFCRPPEVAFLGTPIGVWAAYRALKGAPGARTAFAALIAGAIPGVLLLMIHSWAMTGSPFLPARLSSEQTDAMGTSLWLRFGNNFSYNLQMLAIWFLGPVGLALAAMGAMTDRFTRIVSATVASALVLTLFHDNCGIHIVGPIHYSECAVPLTLIAAYGARQLMQLFSGHALGRAAGALIVLVGLGMPIFTTFQGFALQQQAQLQKLVYASVENGVRRDGPGKAVVLGPDLATVAYSYPPLERIGSWVHDWTRPQLDLSDDILYLRDIPEDIPELRRLLPGRRFYRLQPVEEPPFVVMIPLDQGQPFPLIETLGTRRPR